MTVTITCTIPIAIATTIVLHFLLLLPTIATTSFSCGILTISIIIYCHHPALCTYKYIYIYTIMLVVTIIILVMMIISFLLKARAASGLSDLARRPVRAVAAAWSPGFVEGF